MNKFGKYLISYRYAINGIKLAFKTEYNMLIHLAAALAVAVTNTLLQVTKTEWLITIILVGFALMAEVFNTAIEKLADRVTIEQDELIGKVKDLSSGAVLISCIIAAICAGIIYLPYLW